VNDEKIPIYIADYVLMGYGTGAIMAVPAHDERDYEFAKKFNLPIKQVVKPTNGDGPQGQAFTGDGVAINSPIIDCMPTEQAKQHITAILAREGNAHQSINYKLRDWLFSRQRYWGEPFPILFDESGGAVPVPEDQLPVCLPEMADFKPTGTPNPPLSKATDWLKVNIDGTQYTRETNVMPQWAGSCWYYLRYIDPKNKSRFVDEEKERYWMPVDLYVGGVEHAVLHLLYSRFWHKVLFDLGYVSTAEPFTRLINQGIITGEMEYSTVEDPPRKVSEEEVEKRGDTYVLKSNASIRVRGESFKMSKSRGNVVNPDRIVQNYGSDAFRLYEMYMGPLEAQKPWNTRDIVGMTRFLNAVWRNLIGDTPEGEVEDPHKTRVVDQPIPDVLDRMMHRTIKKVGDDIAALRFNTGIAELIKLNNELNKLQSVPRELAENLALMLSPFAPHIAEEIWSRLGHTKSLARRPWPEFDEKMLVESTMELPVQVNGKLRDRISVPADADEATILSAAQQAAGAQQWLAGKEIKKRLYVPKKLVNFVVVS
jgi:leucyl-tRNA synthetase